MSSPIDTAAFEADPCSVVTKQQLSSLGVTLRKTEPDSSNGGATCQWFLPLGQGSFGGSFLTANPEGLSNTYAKDKAGEWDLFQPVDSIANHPAVIADMRDGRKNGVCFLHVGLRDDLVYNIGVQGEPGVGFLGKNPCGAAQKIAKLALKTMQGGG